MIYTYIYTFANIYTIYTIYIYIYSLQFAAIVSDPPFGIREKAYGHAQSDTTTTNPTSPATITTTNITANNATTPTTNTTPTYPTTSTPTNNTMGDCKRAVSTLFGIAKQHLQLHGKLVFWLPTPAEVTNEGLRVILHDIIAYTGDISVAQELVYIKATPQYLHSKLTRWLCVYQKVR